MSDDIRIAIQRFAEERTYPWEGAQLQVPDGVEVRLEVPYGSAAGVELTTDLFLPPADRFEGPRPAIVFIHGGGWRAGSPTQFYRQAGMLAALGVIGSCCRYRFAPEFTFPAAVHDVKAAVRWLRANAKELGVDPERIGAAGGSAGGHLAAMLATTAGVAELEGDVGSPGERSDVQLAMPLNPITDMTAFVDGTSLHAAVVQFMGGPPEEIPDAYRLASPLLQVDPRTPPCLLAHGSDDHVVPPSQSERFARALESLGIRQELILVDGVGHGFFNAEPHFTPIYEAMERFVLDLFAPQ